MIASLLAFGALVYLAFALGRELFSPWVGVVAALVVLTRPAMQRDALLAYQDVPFAALIVGATLLEARRPRRGAAVLVVLALAGLLRPEAWVLAGLYWLWMWPACTWGERVQARAAGRRRAADLGRLGLGGHRRPAALPARDRRPGDRQRPPPHACPRCRSGPPSTSATRCASRS